MIRAPFASAQVMMDAAGVPAALQAEPKTLAFYTAIATALVASLHDADVGVETILYVSPAGAPAPCTGAAKLR